MTATKTTKPAKDGTAAAYTQDMATDATGLTPYYYIADPGTELLVSPATSANQTSQITQETAAATALGAPADTAWASGSGSAIAVLKKIAGGVAVTTADGANVTQGAIADAAWSGSGSSSVVAALKAIYAKVAAVIGVSQSGTWTVQPGNTANTTAWKIDGSAVTQPVSGTFFQTTQPVSFATTPVAAVRSAALESSHVFKGSAGSVVDAICLASTVTGFFMLFDATSAPADGAVTPLVPPIPVGAGQASSYDFPAGFPLSFGSGLVGVFSTTGPFTKTASATACMSGRVI